MSPEEKNAAAKQTYSFRAITEQTAMRSRAVARDSAVREYHVHAPNEARSNRKLISYLL